MALPASFLEELRARTPLASLVGRRVKLSRSGRHHKGCCPFHNEKTPSFYVYEDGFHCFGCGAHGDAISFLMQNEGVGFTDAVARLAAEAGMDIPAPTPQAAEAERRRLDLFAVMNEAQSLFRRLLTTPDGAAGLAYLRARDLTEATIETHGLGWAPRGGALIAALREAGVEPAQMLQSGLVQDSESGPRVMFFERVTFPIRDTRGRIVSFGARTLGDGQPKYLNGPETPLFMKRRSLYGLDRAREAIRGGAALLVVEGYMDVLRLHQSGFTGAVAPLGTALTTDQLETLWRSSPSPILCFDGDTAGGRAAARTLDLALPLLQPDRTLTVAALPAGEDPDSLVRRQGAQAMQAVVDNRASFADALFAQAREATPGSGPERRAMLHRRLTDAAARIANPVLAREMRNELLNRHFAAQRRPVAAGRRQAQVPDHPVRHPPQIAVGAERARILTAILLRHPDLLHDLEEAYALIDLRGSLEQLRHILRDWSASEPQALDSAALLSHLTQLGRAAETEQALGSTPLPACAAADAQPAEAEAQWWHIFNLLDLGGLNAQVEQAIEDFAANPTKQVEQRLVALCTARDRLRSGEPDD